MKVLRCISTIILLSVSPGMSYGQESVGDLERSIVLLSANKASPDPEAPWNVQNADISGFAGIVIGDNKILAPATLVARAVYIQAQKLEDVTKIPLQVVFVDYEANLALLTPVEGSIHGMTPLALSEDVPINTDLWMIGIENDRQLQRASVKVLELALREVISGGMTLSAYLLTGQTRTVCRGEPLLRKGKLAGICLGISGENQPWALTSQAIRHFLKDQLEVGKYRGFANMGISLSITKSPHLKSEIKWPANVNGVRVSEVQETSPFFGEIEVNDVLSAIDGHAIDNRGFFKHPMWGSIPLRHYLGTRYAGDKLTLKIYRHGNVKEVSQTLKRYNSQDMLIPGLSFEGPLPHLIVGGLVFRELGVDFLSSYGRDWFRSAPSNLLYIYNYENKGMLKRDRVLVMTNVLADPFNQGYDRESVLILDKVNGVVPNNLEELAAALKKPVARGGENFLVFDFDEGAQIVLTTKGMVEAHKRMAKAYNVNTPESFAQ